MGERLQKSKFNTLVNPFGVIFNPLSLSLLLEWALQEQDLPADKAVQVGDWWFHYDLHSSFSASSKEELLQKGKYLLQDTSDFLKKTDYLILTLGTAFIYRLKDSQATVANCHKVPATHFTKELLSPDEITQGLARLCTQLLTCRPRLQILLTVSPVRHIKDSIPLNSVSKSILRVACHQLQEQFEQVTYFPSYEILMDDLRDYRFYKPDMIHPSEVAEDYIWSIFSETYFDDTTQELLKKWEKVSKTLSHKPFNPGSAGHLKFLHDTLEKLQAFKTQLPVDEEIAYITSQLKLYTNTAK
jgi:hypothetical protein